MHCWCHSDHLPGRKEAGHVESSVLCVLLLQSGISSFNFWKRKNMKLGTKGGGEDLGWLRERRMKMIKTHCKRI